MRSARHGPVMGALAVVGVVLLVVLLLLGLHVVFTNL
jgi:hypothetical protein